MLKAIKLKTTTYRPEHIDVPENMDWRWPSQQIGCDLIEILNCPDLSEGCVMIVDDEGMLKEEPKINPIATTIYGDPIVGDVLIMGTEHTPEGPDIAGLSDDQVRKIITNITFMVWGR